MSDSTSSSRDTDSNIEKLGLQTRLVRRPREFRVQAHSKNYWRLYTGDEELLAKPIRQDYFIYPRMRL